MVHGIFCLDFKTLQFCSFSIRIYLHAWCDKHTNSSNYNIDFIKIFLNPNKILIIIAISVHKLQQDIFVFRNDRWKKHFKKLWRIFKILVYCWKMSFRNSSGMELTRYKLVKEKCKLKIKDLMRVIKVF